MPKTDGINALMGIIPIPDHYDINHNAKRINTVYTIDHYAYPSGSKPEKSKRVRGPIIPEVGSIYRSNGALPCKPSYAYIKNGEYTQTIAGLEYTFKIIDNAVFIAQHSLFVGDLLIVDAPHKFTKTKKETFCKAVIHSMVNDQDCFFEQLDRYNVPHLRLSITEERVPA